MVAPPKGGKLRDVLLPDSVAFALAEHITQRPPLKVTLPWKAPDGPSVTASLLFHASVLLDAGKSIEALSDYLGHGDPGFTLRTCTHLMPNSQARARKAVDSVFRRGETPTTAHRRPRTQKTCSDLRRS